LNTDKYGSIFLKQAKTRPKFNKKKEFKKIFKPPYLGPSHFGQLKPFPNFLSAYTLNVLGLNQEVITK